MWVSHIKVLEVWGEEVISEDSSLQEILEDREGRPCSDSSLHHQETTNKNRLDWDCFVCTDGNVRWCSLEESSQSRMAVDVDK